MYRIIQLYRSTIGKKAIVAITGVVLFGFVVLHMLGNLKALTGNDDDGTPHVDMYAHFLRTMGEPMLPYGTAIWATRVILLLSLVLHLVAVIQLAKRNRAARPIRYARPVYVETTPAARGMLVTGLLLLGFVVVHIFHFTIGTPEITPIEPGHVYANLYHAFGVWYIALFYLLAMVMLGSHLYHGAWSLFQTLGLDNPDRNRPLRLFAAVAAALLFLGFISIPILFYLGVMPDPAVVKSASSPFPP